jgi:hypothetical protein
MAQTSTAMQHPDIAEIEVKGQHAEVAARHDGQCAAQRDETPMAFGAPQVLAEKGPGNGDGGDRE